MMDRRVWFRAASGSVPGILALDEDEGIEDDDWEEEDDWDDEDEDEDDWDEEDEEDEDWEDWDEDDDLDVRRAGRPIWNLIVA